MCPIYKSVSQRRRQISPSIEGKTFGFSYIKFKSLAPDLGTENVDVAASIQTLL